MERRLIIMRHGKSSWQSEAQTDHERPLNERGKRDVPRVARHLTNLDWQPQHIVSSDAQRTRETSVLLLAAWEDGIEVEFESKLYLAGFDALQNVLLAVSDEIETLLFVGHNPGCEEIVYRLSDMSVEMKTATSALMSAECDSWADLDDAHWKLHEVVYPRELS